LRAELRGRHGSPGSGGITGYPLDQLHEEVAYIAYHFHWPLERILELEHADRLRWCAEIARINERLNEQVSFEL
jgi:transcriptional antiterminator